MAEPTHLKISGPSKLKGSSWSGRHFMSYCKIGARNEIRGHMLCNLFGENCVGEEFILSEVKVECKAHGVLFTETQMTDNLERQVCPIFVHNRDL